MYKRIIVILMKINMNVKVNDILSLSNNNKYMVLSKTEIDNIVYLYLINVDKPKDIRIVYLDGNSVSKVKDEVLLDKLKLIFLDNTLNYLKDNK